MDWRHRVLELRVKKIKSARKDEKPQRFAEKNLNFAYSLRLCGLA